MVFTEAAVRLHLRTCPPEFRTISKKKKKDARFISSIYDTKACCTSSSMCILLSLPPDMFFCRAEVCHLVTVPLLKSKDTNSEVREVFFFYIKKYDICQNSRKYKSRFRGKAEILSPSVILLLPLGIYNFLLNDESSSVAMLVGILNMVWGHCAFVSWK